MNYNVDYYRILGLDKTASSEDIKKRFRALVRESHPDHAGNSKEVAERFVQIREAYELLSDPVLRDQYDNPPKLKKQHKSIHRKTWRPPSSMRGGSGMNTSTTSIPRNKRGVNNEKNHINLDDILGGSSGGRPKQKPSRINQQTYRRENAVDGEDITINVDIPSNIAHNGGSVMLEYKRCVRGENLSLIQIDEIQYLRVGEKTQYGDILCIPKLGHAGANGGTYGDLNCRVSISKPKGREEEGVQLGEATENKNLYISLSEAVLGGRVEVDTALGKKTLSIPPRTSSGKKLRLRNAGESGGDLILITQIVIPSDLDEESLALIRKFSERNPLSPR
jgi:curved DNA-binding protein